MLRGDTIHMLGGFFMSASRPRSTYGAPLSPAARRVLDEIAYYADHTGHVGVSLSKIAENLNVSLQSVSRRADTLAAGGYISFEAVVDSAGTPLENQVRLNLKLTASQRG